MIVIAILFVGLLVVGAVVLGGLRNWTLAEGRMEATLGEPGEHHLAYDVPNGQDPAVLLAAVNRAGYTATSDMRGGVERLLVDCPTEADRAVVRSALEHVDRTGFDGAEMHVAHVSFEDER